MTNRNKFFKPIASFHNRQTVQYQTQMDLQQKALQAIQQVLSKTLASHTHACVIKDRKLLIYTHSASWASQLRFYSQELQAAVSSKILRPIDKVQLRILHRDRVKKGEYPAVNIPAIENIELIRANALSAPDSKLKTALLKLSHTLRQRHEGK